MGVNGPQRGAKVIMSRYRTNIGQVIGNQLSKPITPDTFGARSYQVLVRDEMVFAPSLSSETLLLDAIRKLKRPVDEPAQRTVHGLTQEELTHG
jgi:hypothetical protein